MNQMNEAIIREKSKSIFQHCQFNFVVAAYRKIKQGNIASER